MATVGGYSLSVQERLFLHQIGCGDTVPAIHEVGMEDVVPYFLDNSTANT
ncbi:MAG: hypothetical protein QF835_08435 [Candidatus Marinimicrobia bacterium]|jgi:hypothetical protein|nr:hypothetical protein [Candidatus Neomarinimicrobiota bacterium]